MSAMALSCNGPATNAGLHLKLTMRSRGDPAKSPVKVHGSRDRKRVTGQECTIRMLL